MLLSDMTKFARLSGYAVQALGATALLGWLGRAAVRSGAEAGALHMPPLAAVCFVIAGIGLVCQRPPLRRWRGIAAALLLALPFMSLIQAARGFQGSGGNSVTMPLILAGCFTLTGIALCMLMLQKFGSLIRGTGLLIALCGVVQVLDFLVTFGDSTSSGMAPESLSAAVGLAVLGTAVLMSLERSEHRHIEIPLKTVLGGMVLASLLPAFVFMASQSRALNEQHLATIRAEGNNAAEDAANLAVNTFSRRIAILRGLSASLALKTADDANGIIPSETLELLHRQMLAAVGNDDGWISLANGAGTQLINTHREPGEMPRSQLSLPAEANRASGGEPRISDLHRSATRPDSQLVTISFPVVGHDLVLDWRMPVDHLSVELKRIAPEGWTYAIADRQGKIVARSNAPEQWIGKPVSPSAWSKAKTSENGSDTTFTVDGVAVFTTWHRLPFGWTALSGVREDLIDGAGRVQTRRLTIGAIAMTVLGLAIATFGALLINRPLSRVSTAGGPLTGTDTSAKAPRAFVREINQLALALTEATRDQRRATASLAESEARLQRFVDQAPAAIAMFDRDMRYLAASHRWQAYFPPDKTEFDTRQPDQGPPHVSEQWRNHHRRGLLGEVLDGDNDAFVGPDGKPQYLRWELRPWLTLDGTIGGTTIMAEDVSEKAIAALALRESEARLKAVVDTATDAIVVVNSEGGIVSFNAAAEKMFGYTASEAFGKMFDALLADIGAEGESKINATWRSLMVDLGTGREATGARKDGSHFPLELSVAQWTVQGHIHGTVIMRDITSRKERENHVRLVMRELSHRTKNALAVVQAMAWQTSRTTNDASEFQRQFTQRVDGLARSIGLLVRSEWEGVSVKDLVEGQLAPFLDDSRQRLQWAGPPLLLKPNAAQDLGLVLHELATNASKYGALSNAAGQVSVKWDVVTRGAGKDVVRLCWQEIDGPAVAEPTRNGFGSTLIRDMLAKTYKAKISLDFQPTGLVWMMEIDVDRIVAHDTHAASSDPSSAIGAKANS